MKTHDEIDRRSLTMARRIVARIDSDPAREGLEHARQVCELLTPIERWEIYREAERAARVGSEDAAIT